VIWLEQLGAARNTNAGAISSGRAGRFIGVSPPNRASRSAGLSVGFSGVHTSYAVTCRPRREALRSKKSA
jgi:hypothetical protein